MTDPVVEAVRSDLLRRSRLGIAKYGVTLGRTDLTLRDWLQHAYEETLDQANYLKRAIIELDIHKDEVPAPSPAPDHAARDVPKLAINLTSIADASVRADGTDIPLGEIVRKAAATLLSLSAETERLREDMMAAQNALGHEIRIKCDVVSALREAEARMREMEADSKLLDVLQCESWDLRCFDIQTGGDDADVGWRVIGHWQAKPHERVIAEVYHDDPKAALRAAIVKETRDTARGGN